MLRFALTILLHLASMLLHFALLLHFAAFLLHFALVLNFATEVTGV